MGEIFFFCKAILQRKALFRQQRHNRVSALACQLFCLRNQLFFQIVGIRQHLAFGNLLVGCAVIAQFQTASPSSGPDRTGDPNVRHVMGRTAYKSQAPVAGSRAGHGSSLANSANAASESSSSLRIPVWGLPGKVADNRRTACRARLLTCAARCGSLDSRSFRPFRSRHASSWLIGNGR